jgi:hypothetical protein
MLFDGAIQAPSPGGNAQPEAIGGIADRLVASLSFPD